MIYSIINSNLMWFQISLHAGFVDRCWSIVVSNPLFPVSILPGKSPLIITSPICISKIDPRDFTEGRLNMYLNIFKCYSLL